ncbi:MAG TPA: exodeoxyribonuclease VII small subunit [Acholeplasma sp.]|jgi:exodeoxyribonuclease VII small subunit|nr:exodeoxyribonuclease VII small subunit [Acholeplasma sp.]
MKDKTFESALAELEEVVKKLENKDIGLDEAIKLYNEGLELSKLCYEKLEKSKELIVEKMEETEV